MQRQRNWVNAILLALLFLLVIFALSCGRDNPLLPDVRQDNEVWIQSDGFHPQSLTVAVGTVVKWVNKDSEVHTVDSGSVGHPTIFFHSKNIKPTTNWSFKFTQKGTFNYYCGIHQRTGKIVVQ